MTLTYELPSYIDDSLVSEVVASLNIIEGINCYSEDHLLFLGIDTRLGNFGIDNIISLGVQIGVVLAKNK